MAKKKKNKDFVKIKLKAGKKIPKNLNETKPEFKTKKILIKPLVPESDIDPLKLLSSSGLKTKLKLVYLGKLRNILSSMETLTQGGEQVQVICKYLTDEAQTVRVEAINCLKKCLELVLKSSNSVGSAPLFSIMLSYINCGLTHINVNIRNDLLRLLTFVVQHCGVSLDPQLMQLFLSKIETSSIGTMDTVYYVILDRLIFKSRANFENIENNTETKPQEEELIVLHWTPENAFLDIHAFDATSGLQDVCFSFQNKITIDIQDKFFEAVKSMVMKDIKVLFGQNSDRQLSTNDAQKAVAALGIGLQLKLHQDILRFWTLASGRICFPEVNITLSNTGGQACKLAEQKLKASLDNQLRSLYNRLHKLADP